jgi:hypothetical protein
MRSISCVSRDPSASLTLRDQTAHQSGSVPSLHLSSRLPSVTKTLAWQISLLLTDLCWDVWQRHSLLAVQVAPMWQATVGDSWLDDLHAPILHVVLELKAPHSYLHVSGAHAVTPLVCRFLQQVVGTT